MSLSMLCQHCSISVIALPRPLDSVLVVIDHASEILAKRLAQVACLLVHAHCVLAVYAVRDASQRVYDTAISAAALKA
jgi:hypothetical protein